MAYYYILSHRTLRIATILGTMVIAVLGLCASVEDGQANIPTNKGATLSRNLTKFTKWTAMLARYRQEAAEEHACTHSSSPTCHKVVEWKALLVQLNSEKFSRLDRINAVNRYINQMPYVEDANNWGKNDYWATPLEFFARNGDCEDYAIAKYFSLLALGFTDEDMRLMVVKDLKRNITHAVLAVDLDNTTYILDNQSPETSPAIAFMHYQPIFAINALNWWRYIS